MFATYTEAKHFFHSVCLLCFVALHVTSFRSQWYQFYIELFRFNWYHCFFHVILVMLFNIQEIVFAVNATFILKIKLPTCKSCCHSCQNVLFESVTHIWNRVHLLMSFFNCLFEKCNYLYVESTVKPFHMELPMFGDEVRTDNWTPHMIEHEWTRKFHWDSNYEEISYLFNLLR